MSLTDEQIDALIQGLQPGRVQHANGQAHLEQWDIRRHLLRVFGWGGFDIEELECTCILERSFWESDADPKSWFKGRHTVAYRMRLRLHVKDPDGNPVGFFDGAAVGDANNQPSFADAHDLALKTADSQALKRCCINLGDRFGLSLYAKGSTAPVVGGSIAHGRVPAPTQHEDVTAGELEEVA